MHLAKPVVPLVTALTVVALATEALAANDDDALDTTPRRHQPPEILVHMDMPHGEPKSWIESHMAIRKGIGLVYRYQVETEDQQKVIFSVGGPVLKRNRYGMMFEVRF